jgi:hypothetical protein
MSNKRKMNAERPFLVDKKGKTCEKSFIKKALFSNFKI